MNLGEFIIVVEFLMLMVDQAETLKLITGGYLSVPPHSRGCSKEQLGDGLYELDELWVLNLNGTFGIWVTWISSIQWLSAV